MADSHSNGRNSASGYGLSSADLIAQSDASANLDLAWLLAVVRRRLWIMLLVAGVLAGTSGALIVMKSRKAEVSYQGSFKVLVEPITAEGRLARLSVSAQSGVTNNSPTEISKVGVGNIDLMDYETQIRVLLSPTILNPILEDLKVRYPDITLVYLQQNLVIERISYEKDGKLEGTKIVEIIYGDEDPEKILFVLETISKAYLEYSLEERLNSLRRGIEHIDQQLPELEARVDKFQKQLQLLRETYELSFPEERAEDLSVQTRELGTQRINTEAQLAELKENYAGLQAELAQGNPIPILLSSVSTQQAYGTLIAQYQANEAQMALQAPQFKESSPPFQMLLEKRDNLQVIMNREATKVLAAIAIQIRDLEARLGYVEQTESDLRGETATFPSVLRQYSDLEREAAVAAESLRTFLTKREALQLDASQREIPWEMISPPELWQATDGQPLTFNDSNPKRTLIVATVLSLLVGIGVGFVVEILHTVYHTPEEVKLSTKLRLLGIIPRMPLLHQIPTAPDGKMTWWHWLNPHYAIARFRGALMSLQGTTKGLGYVEMMQAAIAYRESFRLLYTNISLLGSKQMPIRSLVVGSAARDDGKSTIAQHLAETAAALGQRVLLVDADLRHPQLHQRLGLKNNYGLSDLVRRGLNLNEVIQQHPNQADLFLLSGGSAVDDPVKLFSSPQLEHLMEQFRSFFDLVIYNTPPLVGLSDAQLVAKHADGILLVVRLEQTDRIMVDKALESLKIAGTIVLGCVANDVKNYVPFSYHPPTNLASSPSPSLSGFPPFSSLN